MPLQPDVAVRINQARHEPDPGGQSLRVGYWLSTDYTIDHPEVAILALREHHTG
jgi:hypothetical protein